MGKFYYYDVYDGGNVILTNVTSKEIQEHFGTDYQSMTEFTREKNKKPYLSYLIVRRGAEKPRGLQKKWKKETVCNMADSWKREWDETCKKLREYMGAAGRKEQEMKR